MARNRTLYILVLGILILLTAGGSLYASPMLIWSPTSRSTLYAYGGPAGDFLSPCWYTNMDFEQFFGVVSFYEDRATGERIDFRFTRMAQIGAAARIGGQLHVGAYYGGNAWETLGSIPDGSNVYSYTEKEFRDAGVMKVYDKEPVFGTDRDNNRIYNEAAILIGIGDIMGVRLSYVSTYQLFKLDEDFAVESTNELYKSLRQDFGRINPEIVWGLARDLYPARGIRPEVKLDLNFFRNYLQRERYNSDGGTSGTEIVRSENNLDLGFSVRMGGFNLIKRDGFSFGVDLSYRLGLLLYDNEYSYLNAAGRFETKRAANLQKSNEFSEKTRNEHEISPALSVEWWGDDRLKLKAEFGLGTVISNDRNTYMALKTGSTDGTLVKHGADTDTTTFLFAPAIDLAMQWKAVPDKFLINMGVEINLGGVNIITKQLKDYRQGDENVSFASKGKDVQNIFINASTRLFLGVAFDITKHIEMQALAGINTGNNALNVFDIGSGLGNFVNILATVQF